MNENYDIYRKYLRKMESKLSAWIRNTSAAQLGCLSSTLFIYKLICNKNIVGIEMVDILLMILSIILCVVSIKLSVDYKKNYKKDLEEVTRRYKEFVTNKINKA